MNILEDRNTYQIISSRNWKVLFLKAQNEWLQRYIVKISNIILKYKQLLKLYDIDANIEDIQIQKNQLKQLSEKSIKEVEEQYAKIILFGIQNDQKDFCQLDLQLFSKIIQSHQQSVKLMVSHCTKNQFTLQKIQNPKIKYKGFKGSSNPVPILKTVKQYDIYYQIISIYKRSIGNLKCKKKYLTSKIKNNNSNFTQNTLDSLNQYSANALIKQESRDQDNRQLNLFDKSLIIYKKKKFLNENRLTRNQKLKENINFLKSSIQKIQKSIYNQPCPQFQVTLHNGAFQQLSMFNEFTLIQRTLLKSFSFDRDFSKIISHQNNKPNTEKLNIIDQIYND